MAVFASLSALNSFPDMPEGDVLDFIKQFEHAEAEWHEHQEVKPGKSVDLSELCESHR